LQLDPAPTSIWQWQRCGVLDRELLLTARGAIVSCFLGPEGLAIAAALEERVYGLQDLVFDCANLFGGDRFAGTNPRTLGRLAAVCERVYRRQTIEGYLMEGLPPQYGFGASDVVRALVAEGARVRSVADSQEFAGRGDIDRLMTEWKSLLRQVAAAPPLDVVVGLVPDGSSRVHSMAAERQRAVEQLLAVRWDEFRAAARAQVGEWKTESLPELPALTADQRRVVNHRFFRAKAAAAR
jgi:hypothetical protein